MAVGDDLKINETYTAARDNKLHHDVFSVKL